MEIILPEGYYSINDDNNNNVNNDSKIKFEFDAEEYIIECKENYKMINIYKEFSHKINKDINKLFFLCNNGTRGEDYNNLTFKEMREKFNKREEEIIILVYECNDSFKINSIKTDDEIINQIIFQNDNNYYKEYKFKNNNNEKLEKKSSCSEFENCCLSDLDNDEIEEDRDKFFYKIMLIVTIQLFIIDMVILCDYFYDWHKTYIKSSSSISITFYLVTIVMTLSCIIMWIILNMIIVKEDKSKLGLGLFIYFSLFFILITIFYLFLLRKYAEGDYILGVISYMIIINLWYLVPCLCFDTKDCCIIFATLICIILTNYVYFFLIVKDWIKKKEYLNAVDFYSLIIGSGVFYFIYLSIYVKWIDKWKIINYKFGVVLFNFLIYSPLAVAALIFLLFKIMLELANFLESIFKSLINKLFNK